jgi:GT2 family glycosyltransferase
MPDDQTIPADAFGALARAFHDPGTHRATLPLLAGGLLGQAGQLREALMLVDRFHRTGPDTVASRLVESSARARLGDPGGALAALRRAVAVDPADPAAAGTLLRAMATTGDRRTMSKVVDRALSGQSDPSHAAGLLDLGKPGWVSHGRVERNGQSLSGWLVWREGGAKRDIVLEVGGRDLRVGVSATQRLPGGARLGRFVTPLPLTVPVIAVRDAMTGTPLAGSPLVDDGALDVDRPPPEGDGVAVIVPLYGDAAATARCLESILSSPCETAFRLVLVDDASPSAAVRRLGERLAEEGLAWRLENPANLGFIRSVNRALRWLPECDVVLLNADTVVAPGWLDRLAAAAHRPGVGTATPLSNNGELVSVPRPFRPVPIPSPDEVAAIDAQCATRFAGQSVELPNGVGFCLYVNAAARRAAGLLDSERYERGYLEEVDYCLRVREAGLSSVAALDVFVGHEGTVSFGPEKRSLVRRNAQALARRWPTIHTETDAFVAADPLAPVRTLSALWDHGTREPRIGLVVARPWREAILTDVATEGAPPIIVVPDGETGRLSLRLSPGEPAVTAPDDLEGLLRAAGVTRLRLADWGDLSESQLHQLIATSLPLDIFVADAAVASAARRPGQAGALSALLVARSDAFLAPCAAAASAVKAAWPGRSSAVHLLEPAPVPALVRSIPARRHHVGVLVTDPGSRDLVAALARALADRRSPIRLVVLGDVSEPVALMRAPGVFVAGPGPDADSLTDAIDTHGCSALLLPLREAIFVHPALEAAAASGLPCAGWPVGGAREVLGIHQASLALDAATTVAGLAEILDLRWGAGHRPAEASARVA